MDFRRREALFAFAAPALPTALLTQTPIRRDRRILLIDPQDGVRGIISLCMTKRFDAACTSVETLAAGLGELFSSRGTYDLLIYGHDGDQCDPLVGELAARFESGPAVITSGYGPGLPAGRRYPRGLQHLERPFSLKQFEVAVERASGWRAAPRQIS